jgi:hypothetical protein
VAAKYWGITILIVFSLSVVAQILLERNNFADSIGAWYTLYSAAIYTIIIAALLFLLLKILNYFN